jgi:phosphate transport system permease protein
MGREREWGLAAAAVLAAMLLALTVWSGYGLVALVGRFGLAPVLLGKTWRPEAGAVGLMPYIWGSVVVGVMATALGSALGLATAVAVGRRLAAWAATPVRSLLTAFTAVPSVILGWWGLNAVVPWVRALTHGPGFSLLAAGLTVGVMIAPTVAVMGVAAVEGVPRLWEEASDALGAAPDQTLLRLTIPAAAPGLARAVLLGAGRALAETMAAQMVIGSQPVARLALADPGSTLTTGILVNMAVWPPGSPGGQAVTAMALLLLVGAWWIARQLRTWEEGR